MPEALAIVAIVVVALAAWIGALLHTRNPANYNAVREAERLRQHAAWLEQRIEVAQREKWGSHMLEPLTAELRTTSNALARVRQSRAS
jgi:hypothetical protein